LTQFTLADLGWSDRFARQITDDDANLAPARVAELHRRQIVALWEAGELRLALIEIAGAYAVGDWVLTAGTTALRRLDPLTDLHRRAAGHTVTAQRITANVDTIGIVSSCNDDFNIARLERYLAQAMASDALPLIILTKSDQSDDSARCARRYMADG
jgi:ribosome biogenesis GTPase